jgi:hypothetical protein
MAKYKQLDSHFPSFFKLMGHGGTDRHFQRQNIFKNNNQTPIPH